MPLYFEDQILDASRRELKRGGEAITVEPRVFDLLLFLIEHRNRLVTKDDLIAHIWRGRIVSDSALTSAINAARKAVGDSGQDQRLIRTSARKGFRFIGEVHTADRPGPDVGPRDAVLPVTRYAQSGEVNIAYQVMGAGQIDVVIIPGIISHVEYMHELPGYTDALRRISAFGRVITFDKRGTGLSDRPADAPSFEQRMDDIHAVMDAVRSDRAVLMGFSDGAALAALFAATYPERSSHLVLYGGIAQGQSRSPEMLEEFLAHRLKTWGSGSFVKIVASGNRPVDTETMEKFGKMERLAMSPGAFKALLTLNNKIDVVPILSSIQVPTQVVRRQGDALVSIERGRALTALIPGATFHEYPDGDHAFWTGDTETMFGDVEQFVTGGRQCSPAENDRVLATVLSTRIVASSKCVTGLDRVGRQIVQRHRGTLVRVSGESLIATFDGPGRAVRCALEITSAAREIGVSLQAGLHTGEIECHDRDVGGPAVYAATRVMSQSKPGEVLVSRVVLDLVAGTGLFFEERASNPLEALPGLQQLFVAIRP